MTGSSSSWRALCAALTLGLAVPAAVEAQDCTCGAPCDLLFESAVAVAESRSACNTITVIGASVLAGGIADLTAGRTVTILSGFSVESGGAFSVTIDALLACDPTIDADLDGVDACLDCDEADGDNWVSCLSCVDGDLDGAWTGCDAYVTRSGPDCDDGDTNRKPGATESCNSIDDNCDGLVDECLVCGVPVVAVPEAPACRACEGRRRGKERV